MPVHIKTRAGKHGKHYLIYYRRGGRGFPQEYAGSFPTLKLALACRDVVAMALATGQDPRAVLEAHRNPPPPAPGLEEVWDACIGSLVNIGDKAKGQYRHSRDRWLPLLGSDRDPASIGAADVIDGIAAMLNGDPDSGVTPLAASSVRQYVSKLGIVLDFAEVFPNPVKSPKVKLPAQVKGEKQLPSNPVWRAIRVATKKRSAGPLRLMEACALRVSEAAQLELGDIDFIEGQARIRREATKTAAGRRWTPVPPELLEEIQARIPPDDRTAHRLVYGPAAAQIAYDFDRACTRAGAASFTTHALRHRRISLMLRHGIDPVQVARWAGHSRPSESLNTYGHVVLDPFGDEWRDFWLDTYAATGTRREAPVRHGEAV